MTILEFLAKAEARLDEAPESMPVDRAQAMLVLAWLRGLAIKQPVESAPYEWDGNPPKFGMW